MLRYALRVGREPLVPASRCFHSLKYDTFIFSSVHCEFSPHHYREILEAVKGEIGSVSEKKRIILTHDIDILPSLALKMAKVEAAENVHATYYVLLHSETYNALSEENINIIREIKSLGHELALHYDGRYDYHLRAVMDAFNAIYENNGIDVSHHLKDIIKEVVVPYDLRNRADLTKEGYRYIADSGGWWRDGCVCKHLDEKLLFVCHPVWWSYPNETFRFIYLELKKRDRIACKTWADRVAEHRKQNGI